LLKRDLKAENESETKAEQENALRTQYHTTKVLKGKYTANAKYVKNMAR